MADDDSVAKLFTLATDGTWHEIGFGVATIDKQDSNAPRLIIRAVDDSELLMDTPISTDDIYMVQRDTVLVWSDPEIGKDMAISFNTADYCREIVGQIYQFHETIKSMRSSTTVLDTKDSSGTDAFSSPWVVSRENLPALVLAANENKARFGHYIMNYQKSHQRKRVE